MQYITIYRVKPYTVMGLLTISISIGNHMLGRKMGEP